MVDLGRFFGTALQFMQDLLQKYHAQYQFDDFSQFYEDQVTKISMEGITALLNSEGHKIFVKNEVDENVDLFLDEILYEIGDEFNHLNNKSSESDYQYLLINDNYFTDVKRILKRENPDFLCYADLARTKLIDSALYQESLDKIADRHISVAVPAFLSECGNMTVNKDNNKLVFEGKYDNISFDSSYDPDITIYDFKFSLQKQLVSYSDKQFGLSKTIQDALDIPEEQPKQQYRSNYRP